jgi:hypothetical protein
MLFTRLLILAFCLVGFTAARAQDNNPSAALPHNFQDRESNQWVIQPGGWFTMGGNVPTYANAAMLLYNGSQQLTQHLNRASVVAKTGELILVGEPRQPVNPRTRPVEVTRRILFNPDGPYVRYIDILKNPSAQDVSVTLQIQSVMNFGVQTANTITDPKAKSNVLGWTAQTHGAKAVVGMYAGKNSKFPIAITHQQGNNVVQASFSVNVPAGQEVAIAHFHGTVNGMDAGLEFVNSARESKLFADLPPAVRKVIVNFRLNNQFVGDRELLRGEAADVIEMRSGDVIRGTIKEQGFVVQTIFGNVEMPADKVLGGFNTGEFRPVQLLVTVDGELIGGHLTRDVISIELANGQTTQVPLSQISRFGYRKRAGEPEEMSLNKPFVELRSGDRVAIELPVEPIEFVTRLGSLQLPPSSVHTILFDSEEHGVHELRLVDGTKLAGLTAGETIVLKLANFERQITVQQSLVRSLRLSTKTLEEDDSAARLLLTSGDAILGGLVGTLKLQTTFDTITLNAAEVRALTRVERTGGVDVQVTLWDQSILSGALHEPLVTARVVGGIELKIPIALVQSYVQPLPQPSTTMVEQIRKLVKELSAEDWKARDLAESQLVALGPAVITTLKEMRDGEIPEGQQRIDNILKALEVEKGR